MNGFFQLLIAWGVLLVFVLMLYMIDKFNVVFSGFTQAELPQTYTDGLFGELYGKPLWDAMSGLPIPGIEKKLVENLKPHYEPVLRQHIEQVFMEGYHNARESKLGVPSNNRMIPTPRGALESWLPLHHLTSIYEAGSEFYSKPDNDVMRIQQNLDQITSMLYARVGISLLDPYSRTLMVHPIGVEREHAIQADQSAVSAQDNVKQGVTSASEGGQSLAAPFLPPAPDAALSANSASNASTDGQTQSGSGVNDATALSAGDSQSSASPSSSAQEPEGMLVQPNLTGLRTDQTVPAGT